MLIYIFACGIEFTKPPILSSSKYLGCFRDAQDRALPVRINGSLSLSDCLSTCSSQGYKYAGRQYLGECYCGNSDYDKHGQSDKCNACDSVNVGAYKSCVYELFGNPSPIIAPTPTASVPIALPTSGPIDSSQVRFKNPFSC